MDMTKADEIRQMDDQKLCDLLCWLTESHCETCWFGKLFGVHGYKGDECGAMDYLHQEDTKYDEW